MSMEQNVLMKTLVSKACWIDEKKSDKTQLEDFMRQKQKFIALDKENTLNKIPENMHAKKFPFILCQTNLIFLSFNKLNVLKLIELIDFNNSS